jgi:hypothetical protein
MISSREALVVVLSRRCRSRTEQKRVEERFQAGLCLMKKQSQPTQSDDLADCPNPTVDTDKRPVASRGCCSACYQAFTDHLKTLSQEDAVRMEQDAIARGWILALQESRTIKSRYAFNKLVS